MSTLKEKAEQILAEKESKIIPENLRNSVTAFGVAGTYTGSGIDTSDATATANDLAQNKTAYVNGQKITGAVHLIDSNIDVSADSLEDKTSLNNLLYMHITFSEPIMFGENSRGDFHINSTTAASVIGLTPSKIKQGETILGVTGTYEGSGSGSINLTDDVSFMGSDFVTLPDWIINANWSTLRDPVEMFSNCWQLDEIPAIDISNCHTLNAMFRGCTNLIIVPVLNVSRTEDMLDMWSGCDNLSNDSLNNIMTMCVNATSNFVGTKTLAYIGLTETQADICETLSKYSDFISAGWSTGY